MNYLSKDEFIEIYKSFNYSNIYYTGSIKGMKNLGYWDKKDTCIRCGKYVYNVSRHLSNEN